MRIKYFLNVFFGICVLIPAMLKGQLNQNEGRINSADSKQILAISSDSSKIDTPQVMAQFPGGESNFRLYLMDRMRYPGRCQDEGLSGRVRVQFVVEVDGRITDIKIIEQCKSCPEFEQEAIRVIKQSPRWIPAENNGKKIRSYYVQPFIMALD